MRCPRCNTVVPKEAEICPHCGEELMVESLSSVDLEALWEDAVTPATGHQLDGSQVAARRGEGSQAEVYTSAPSGPQVAARLQASAQPPVQPPEPPVLDEGGPPPLPAAAAAEPQPARVPFGGQAQIATHIASGDPEAHRNTRIVEVSVPAVVRRAARAQAPAPVAKKPAQQPGATSAASINKSIDEAGEGIRLFYARMHRVDRWAFWITMVSFVAAFLPWRYVLGEGLRSGIEGFGVASAGAAAVVVLCIYARTARRRLTGLVLLLQLVAAAGMTAVPVYCFFSEPGLAFHAGLYLTAIGGAATIILTFTRMAVRTV
jgi:hypothetical protein